MKKFLFIAVLMSCVSMAVPALAAEANANDVSVYLLKDWLPEDPGCKIDRDGDLIVTVDGSKIIISVNPDLRLIRFWSFFGSYDEANLGEMIYLANKFNYEKPFLRVAIDPDSGISFCDYHMSYYDGLNSENFKMILAMFVITQKYWGEFVIDNVE